MKDFLITVLGAIVGAVLVNFAMWLRGRKKRKADALRWAEMERHSKLAEKALLERNYERYEFHMKEAASYFKEPKNP